MSQSSDPSPERTPGMEPGGSVPPGETPPAADSASGATDHQPDLPSGRTNKVVYGIIIAVVVLVAAMLIAYAVGLFD